MERLGDYEIVRRLGQGGMGVVHLARSTRLDRLVALKVLAPEAAADERLRARLRQEAATLATLSHPHVIAVHDYGEVDGHVYLAMQLVDGPSLAQLLARGPLAPEHACAVAAQVADALAAAHAAGILHRDVKPSNVLTVAAAQPLVWLADFGIAGEQLADGPSLGVRAYAAPERLRGEHAQPSSDTYSLGCLVVAMLVGQPPWWPADEPMPELCVGVLTGLGAGRLVGLVQELLAARPGDRPQDLREVAARLRRGAVELRPSVAPVRRPARRWVVGVVSALAVIALLLPVLALRQPAHHDRHALRQAVPSSVHDCTAIAQPVPGADDEVSCATLPGLSRLRVSASGTSSAQKQVVTSYLGGSGTASTPWSDPSGRGGRLWFAPGPAPRYVWTDDRRHVTYLVEAVDGDASALRSWWLGLTYDGAWPAASAGGRSRALPESTVPADEISPSERSTT